MTTTTIPASRLDMVAQVRTMCYTELEQSTSAAWISAMRRILDTPIEHMAAWMRPNDSLWANVNLALAMTDQMREVS
jgi:hypothetical protein